MVTNGRLKKSRLENLRVPSSLAGLLQARLDTLLYPEKVLLQRAAVIGRVFYDSGIAALNNADDMQLDDIPSLLKELVEREFIYQRDFLCF